MFLFDFVTIANTLFCLILQLNILSAKQNASSEMYREVPVHVIWDVTYMVRRVLGPERDELKAGWRKLHNGQHYGLHSS